jgi:hypothetical protein
VLSFDRCPIRDARSRKRVECFADSAQEAVLGRLAQAILAVRHGADFARQADLAEHTSPRQRQVAEAGETRPAAPADRRRFRSRAPADHVDEDVLVEQRHAAVAVQHRQQHRQPVVLQPECDTARVAQRLSSTSACTSTSRAACPPRDHRDALPGTGWSCAERKIAEGLLTSRRPLSVMANTPSSLTAPKRFLTARTTR